MRQKKFKISVIGMGYVGLPTAIELYNCGHTIHGVDVSEPVILNLKNRYDILNDEANAKKIPKLSERWSLATYYDEKISDSDLIIVTVPTPINKENLPDLSHVKSSIESIMSLIRKSSGTIVVLESTVYPGVTRSVISDVSSKKGLIQGEDFFFAYCPERINPGSTDNDIKSIKRIVGCDNDNVGMILADLYSEISAGAVFVGKPEIAEAAKLIENVQRDVDIALANEMAVVMESLNLDVEEVFEAASSKWNFHRHKPGIGVGGHCIAVDPYYYLSIFSKQNSLDSSMVNISRSTNNFMPVLAAERICNSFSLNNGDRVLVIGYSYKKNVGDGRNTPVKILVDQLADRGINCSILDPICSIPPGNYETHEEWGTLSDDYEVVVIGTPHDKFNLSAEKLAEVCTGKKIFDGRRVLDKDSFIQAGWEFSAIGLGV